MTPWFRLRCFFNRSQDCKKWNPDYDDTIRFLRAEKQSAEDAADKLRRNRMAADPITRVYGGWDREERAQ